MIIDLHTHTKPWSDDSNLELPALIHKAKQAGLDGVCLTEHDYFWDKDELARLSQQHDFLILPGVEIENMEGHILVFGVAKYSPDMHRAEHLRHIVDEAGGVMILAHPFRGRFYEVDDIHDALEQCYQEPIFRLVDTIETFNGRGSEKQNRFCRELGRRLNLEGVGGSDAHTTLHLPSCATFFERKVGNVEELITELKAGRFRGVDLRQGS